MCFVFILSLEKYIFLQLFRCRNEGKGVNGHVKLKKKISIIFFMKSHFSDVQNDIGFAYRLKLEGLSIQNVSGVKENLLKKNFFPIGRQRNFLEKKS